MGSMVGWAVLDKRKISGFCRNSKVSSAFRLLYKQNYLYGTACLQKQTLLNRCTACDLLQFGHYAHQHNWHNKNLFRIVHLLILTPHLFLVC